MLAFSLHVLIGFVSIVVCLRVSEQVLMLFTVNVFIHDSNNTCAQLLQTHLLSVFFAD